MTLDKKTIRIIFPGSRDRDQMLVSRLPELAKHFQVRYDPNQVALEESWPFTSASVQQSLKILSESLLEVGVDAVWAGRGGYGVSDLLPQLPWTLLTRQKAKFVVGFSDISSLHAALFTKLRWPCLHAPMPGSALWPEKDLSEDCNLAIDIVKGTACGGSLPLSEGLTADETIEGWLFGGCLSVLSATIGTPYFPRSLANAILFLEDVDENPGRLMRSMNQWDQAGVLNGVRAIVIGNLKKCNPNRPESTGAEFVAELRKRIDIPVVKSEYFGHVAPNMPLLLGAKATILQNTLSWTFNKRDFIS